MDLCFINDFGFPIQPIVPLWLLLCCCSHLKCSCLAKWHPSILLLDDLHTYFPLLISPTPSIHIQFIEFKNNVTTKFLGTMNTPKTWQIQPCFKHDLIIWMPSWTLLIIPIHKRWRIHLQTLLLFVSKIPHLTFPHKKIYMST